MEALKVKCKCDGVKEAAKAKFDSMKAAGAMNYKAKMAADDVLYGDWDQCKCRASKLKRQGPYRVLANEEPGDEFRDPKDTDRSIPMILVVEQKATALPLFAKWDYKNHLFYGIFGDSDIHKETMNSCAKLWYPLPVLKDDLWDSVLPQLETTEDKN
jgi:sucrose-6-phosphate hydrolase SacC (GH32 family)